MDTLISELIALVQQTAPELWRIAMRQVMVQVIANALMLVVLALVIVGGLITIKKVRAWRKSDDFDKYDNGDTSEIIYTVTGVIVFASIIGFVISIFTLVSHILNPEYYAIQVLLDLVRQ